MPHVAPRTSHGNIRFDRQRLKALVQPAPGRLLLQTAAEWLAILVLILAAHAGGNLMFGGLCMLLIATRQHALLALMHEYAHFQLSRRRAWLNDLVGDVLTPELFTAPTRCSNAADVRNDHGGSVRGRSLFGISLSSNNADAVHAIFAFFYPRALQAGWRDIYLGSPIPGFRKARARNPTLTVWQYVHARRHAATHEPLDPQLRYYHRKGFRQIVSIQKDYFPHPESLDYGVILRGEIPLARPTRLWRMVPLPVLERVASVGLKLSLR